MVNFGDQCLKPLNETHQAAKHIKLHLNQLTILEKGGHNAPQVEYWTSKFVRKNFLVRAEGAQPAPPVGMGDPSPHPTLDRPWPTPFTNPGSATDNVRLLNCVV